MKKQILTLLAIATILFSACKKDDADQTTKETSAYQPFTAGSNWNYRDESFDPTDATVDTSVNTMTAVTKIFGGKTFTQLTAVTGLDSENTYFGFSNHVYYYRIPFDGAEAGLELPYLNEEVAVNGTWTSPVTFVDQEWQIKGTIIEKDIDKGILNKNYSNVIHSKLELQYKSAGTFTTRFTFDFYVAKNIGIIAIYIGLDGNPLTKSELISYNIK